MKRALRYLLILVVVLGLCAALFGSTLLGAMGAYLVQAEPPHKADIVLVLAGDASGNRILKAASLVRDGYAPKVLVSGPAGVYGFHECELAIPFAVKAGYPESYFLHFEHNARSTTEEARDSAAKLKELGAHDVLLVTSDYHTRRALRTFRKEVPGVAFTPIAAPDEYFSADGWWHNREGRKTMLYESLKTVASWFGI